MGLTWQPWASVSQGTTTPGAPVAAIPWESSFALFLSDPSGGVYAIKATPGFGWEAIPGRSTRPGAPITALLSGNRFTLFMADSNGEVFTTSGAPYQGWHPWTSVSQGTTTPGAPVAAIPWENSFALFLSDPSGGIYAIKAIPGFGWEAVPGRSSKPGGQIAVLPWYRPPASSSAAQRALLFMVDVDGQVSFSSGRPYQGWDPWASVSGSSTVPGAQVMTLPPQGSGSKPFTLFIANSGGEVYATRTSGPPATPSLLVTGVTAQTIDVSWSESNPASVELDGFELSITRMRNNGTETKSVVEGPTIRSFAWTGLEAGVQYTIQIVAFSANGYSPASTVTATTPAGVTAATLTAGVTNLEANYGLLIRGSNFGKGEQVAVTVDWTVGSDPAQAFPLLANTDSVVGGFQTTFTGVDPSGFCPISVPFGDPQPQQTFQVTARGLTSGRTASATAGPFTCP